MSAPDFRVLAESVYYAYNLSAIEHYLRDAYAAGRRDGIAAAAKVGDAYDVVIGADIRALGDA